MTAKIIYDVFIRILRSLRSGSTTPTMAFHFKSDIDRVVRDIWSEQEAIGWDQILKGILSTIRGKAQALCYDKIPNIRDSKLYSEKEWMFKTVGSLIDFALRLWNERCDSLHGATEAENKTIRKDKIDHTGRVMVLGNGNNTRRIPIFISGQHWRSYKEVSTISE